MWPEIAGKNDKACFDANGPYPVSYVLQVYRAQSNFVLQPLLLVLHFLIATSIYPVHTKTYNMECTGRYERKANPVQCTE